MFDLYVNNKIQFIVLLLRLNELHLIFLAAVNSPAEVGEGLGQSRYPLDRRYFKPALPRASLPTKLL